MQYLFFSICCNEGLCYTYLFFLNNSNKGLCSMYKKNSNKCLNNIYFEKQW